MKTICPIVRFNFTISLLLTLAVAGCCAKKTSLVDDAGGRKPGDFPEITQDVFKPMDGGIALGPDEIKGRNTWNLWCAGTEQFWDRMSRESYGLIDLLKTIDSRNRGTRFKELGLINEPGFRQATKPDQYGLYIDEAVEPEPAAIDPKVYGRPTGIMGFRLFPNPDFRGETTNQWDAKRYYNDNDYAISPKLIRPYRVGISCGSCHIAFNPCKPPDDPENPKWENLASAIGNQYIREGPVFAHNVTKGRFFWEMLENQPPGTSDTSRIATDHINNPNTINPIFLLGERLKVAQEENLAGDTLRLPGVKARMPVPHVLKDGADSVGVPGATLRVYINIGSYSQHWLQQHNALIGLTPQKPFSIATAQSNSVYWLATQTKFENVAKFFTQLKSFRLQDAPGGAAYITTDEKIMKQGKLVFAANCAECHSSKRPPAGTNETEWFQQAVLQPDFAEDNFFSDDQRYPLNKPKLHTNAERACGTNAKRGHIWDSFSSEDYKSLPAIGAIDVWNPYTGKDEKFTVSDGGPGYYRTASLISVWSSAPLLHNNVLGDFTGDPSVAGRIRAFTNAMDRLLWPERRLNHDSIWRTKQDCWLEFHRAVLPWFLKPLCDLLNVYCFWAGIGIAVGLVLWLVGKTRHVPVLRKSGFGLGMVALLIILGNLTLGRHVLKLGPIPKGTPVNLLANLDPEIGKWQLFKLALKINHVLVKIETQHLDSDKAHELMRSELAEDLWRASKCPDFVEDRGHTFGADLQDSDKRALIEYLKTL